MKLNDLIEFFNEATEIFEYNLSGLYITNHTSFGIDDEDNLLVLSGNHVRDVDENNYIDMDTEVTVKNNYIEIPAHNIKLKLHKLIEIKIEV